MVPEGKARISIQVNPSARQNRVVGFQDGLLKVSIAAPPTRGRANQELLRFLGDLLGISRSNLIIEQGARSRKKIVAVSGLSQSEVLRLLERFHP